MSVIVGGLKHMHRFGSQRGFNLVEAMVTLVVVSVGMIGIAALYGQGLGAGRTALYRSVAVNLAGDMADRIRLNRIGRANYSGGGAAAPCDPGGGVKCTEVQMANQDLFSWNQLVARSLPNGTGTVTFAGGLPPTYTIGVAWVETGVEDPVTYQIAIQVPSL